MSLLERYIFRRALTFSLGSLGSLVLIVWIVQALQRVDIVRSSASAAGNMFWIATMLIPNLLAGVVPFAVVIGAVQALNSLNADSERAVIAASGARNSVVIRPIVALGLSGAALILVISHLIGPMAQGAFFNGLRAVNADAITLFLTPGRFEEIQDKFVVGVGDVRGSTISNLFISDQRDPTTDLAYFAKEAQIAERDDDSYLLLRDGQVHRRTVADGAISVIQFQTYAFDLATLRPEGDGDWIRNSERSTLDLLRADATDKSVQNNPSAFAKELTQRFSDWLYPLAFALWALVVAGRPRTNRQGAGPAMALGLSGALGLKALSFVVLALIDHDTSYQILAYLLPLASIASSAVFLWADVDVAGSRLLTGLGDGLRWIGQLFRRDPAHSGAR
ncbi:LPS export ABC transporter permease LptF [Aureimonas endophytica]|uniref:LPS export ABC transporter permease LptF n=1 Tax=Aureimonas endophytica TaxID=2027858 RepID=A0A916ZCC4_9HYPH|nr:LptF/LptG family permease [Aureimonas endophytica]GGD85676.1 LPS export ABC transporter permease LptF [Aureimonas endophytica]